jgi:hypothetical protein
LSPITTAGLPAPGFDEALAELLVDFCDRDSGYDGQQDDS